MDRDAQYTVVMCSKDVKGDGLDIKLWECLIRLTLSLAVQNAKLRLARDYTESMDWLELLFPANVLSVCTLTMSALQ